MASADLNRRRYVTSCSTIPTGKDWAVVRYDDVGLTTLLQVYGAVLDVFSKKINFIDKYKERDLPFSKFVIQPELAVKHLINLRFSHSSS